MDVNTFPTIKVFVNHKGPFNFIFDTGASGETIRLDSAFASQFRFEVIDSVETGDPSGRNSRILPVVNIDMIQVGSLKFKNIKSIISKYPYKGISGVLGLAIFKEFLITLDFPNKQLILEEGELRKNDGTVLSYENIMGVPVCSITVGDQNLKADIDCGNTKAGIQLPGDVANKLTFISAPTIIGKAGTSSTKIALQSGQVKETFTLGNIKINQPNIIFPTIGSIANLGFLFLKDYAITFDQKNLRMKMLQEQGIAYNNPGQTKNQDTTSLTDYAGLYSKEKLIKIVDNKLYYQKIDGRGAVLIALGKDVFKFENADATITFKRNDKNIVKEFEIFWYDGVKDVSEKINN